MQKLDNIGEIWEKIFEQYPILMLRFVRYAAECGEDLDAEIRDAILDRSDIIRKANVEEIEEELRKILLSEHPDMLREAYELGLTRYFLPEFDCMMKTAQNNPHHKYCVGEHTLHALLHIPAQPLLRYTMLLHDIGKPLTKTTDENKIDHFYEHYAVGCDVAKVVLRRLKFDESSIYFITTLIQWHDYRWESPGYVGKDIIRKVMGDIKKELILPLIWVQKADVLAQSSFKQQDKLAILDQVENLYYEILQEDKRLNEKDLDINEKQLRQLGICDTTRTEEILQILSSMIEKEPSLNQNQALKELAVRINKTL